MIDFKLVLSSKGFRLLIGVSTIVRVFSVQVFPRGERSGTFVPVRSISTSVCIDETTLISTMPLPDKLRWVIAVIPDRGLRSVIPSPAKYRFRICINGDSRFKFVIAVPCK